MFCYIENCIGQVKSYRRIRHLFLITSPCLGYMQMMSHRSSANTNFYLF